MTYQFVAALAQALGGRVGQVRIDRVEEETYLAGISIAWQPNGFDTDEVMRPFG